LCLLWRRVRRLKRSTDPLFISTTRGGEEGGVSNYGGRGSVTYWIDKSPRGEHNFCLLKAFCERKESGKNPKREDQHYRGERPPSGRGGRTYHALKTEKRKM